MLQTLQERNYLYFLYTSKYFLIEIFAFRKKKRITLDICILAN